MKRIISLFFAAILMLNACSTAETGQDRLTVKTTLFPQYDIARQIGGEYADVQLILPPGVEAHSFEPTPKDIAAMEQADLFIYTSHTMEPWTERITSDNQLEAAAGVETLEESDEAHEEASHEGHAHGEVDPHFWTSPHHALTMIDTIAEAMMEKDPAHKTEYEKNYQALRRTFEALDEQYRSELAALKSKEFLFAGHSVFGYVAHEYGIRFITPYEGFSPDSEPSARRIAELIETLKQKGTKVIFHEELIEPKIAKVISEQTGAALEILHGAHNVSKEEAASGLHYQDILEQNLQKLMKASQ